MSLVVVGSLAYDAVETPRGRMDRMLGGACTYISLSASYFTSVAIVGIVGEDFAQADVDLLASRGIDLEGLERVPGKTFFWSGVYSADMNDRTTLQTDLNVFAGFNPNLPPSYRRQPYMFLGNIQPALQRAVRAQIADPRLVGGDTMNYWIQGYRDELAATIRDWDVLLVNDSEARELSGQTNLKAAARAILAMGPRAVVIKRGEFGALLFWRDPEHPEDDLHWHSAPGYLLEDLYDPTGAGDCFAGGFMGYLASQGFDLQGAVADPRELLRAVIYGSVMGSFCCERFGIERFRTLTRAEIDERYREFQRAATF